MLLSRLSNSKRFLWIILAALALMLAACSSSAEKFNQDGNQAYAEQAYLEALELYQSAQIESPGLAEPYYNAANTLYRQGSYPEALEQIQMALQYVDEEALAESSFYNLGNTFFNSQDPGTAVEAYKQALLLDPDDLDAKYNLELALQQQEQQEQDQKQDESESDEDQESQQDQESEGDQSEEDQEQSQNGENDAGQDQEGDQSEKDDQGDGDQEQDQNQDNGDGEPQDEDQTGDQSPSQIPEPGQRMTAEQARQLLAAIAKDMQTLQERLGQYFLFNQLPPIQDW